MDPKPAKRAKPEKSAKRKRTDSEKPAQRVRTDRQSDLSELLRSGQYSDLQLKCGGESFNVHKAVVCAQSPVLARAVDGDFQEAKTGVVVIKEFPVDVVRQMVAFLYDGVYKTDLEEAGGSADDGEADPTLLFHMRMNAIADYYDIESLRAASRNSLQQALEQSEDGGEILELVSTARESNGDKKLHGLLGTAAIRYLPQLIKDGTLADHCKDQFEYQLIVACNKEMAANAKFRAKWEKTVPARLRCFLEKFSESDPDRPPTVACVKCDKTFYLRNDSFTLTKGYLEDCEDDEDREAELDEYERGPLTVRCHRCGHLLA